MKLTVLLIVLAIQAYGQHMDFQHSDRRFGVPDRDNRSAFSDTALILETQAARIHQILRDYPQLKEGYVLQDRKTNVVYGWVFRLVTPEFMFGPIPVSVLPGASDSEITNAIVTAVMTARFYEFMIGETKKPKNQ